MHLIQNVAETGATGRPTLDGHNLGSSAAQVHLSMDGGGRSKPKGDYNSPSAESPWRSTALMMISLTAKASRWTEAGPPLFVKCLINRVSLLQTRITVMSAGSQ